VVEYAREIEARVSPRLTVWSVTSPGSSVGDALGEAGGRVDGSADEDGLANAVAEADGGGLAAPGDVGDAAGVVHAETRTSRVSSPAIQVVRGIG
jgi:hypothetical protein